MLSRNGLPPAVREMSTKASALGALLEDLERWRTQAQRVEATAPVAAVLAAVLADLRTAVPACDAPPSVPRLATDDAEAGLLSPQQAAERLGVSVRWLYRHASSLPFVRRLTRRSLRFDPTGLMRWVASRGP